MSSSDKVALVLEAADPGTEVFLSDGGLQLLESGCGSLSREVSPGIYKVRLRAGNATRDEVLVVDEKRGADGKVMPFTKTFGPVEFASPVPLQATTTCLPPELVAATKEKVNVSHGEGSWVFVLARHNLRESDHPARWLTLRDASGSILADFADQSDRGPEPFAWSTCNVELLPGSYSLALAPPGEPVQCLPVTAVPGWQLQIFIEPLTRPSLDCLSLNLSGAAILYSRNRQFDPANRELRLAELARIGVVNRRKVLSDMELKRILHLNWNNPMLGLFAAHLARLVWPNEPELLRVAIGNLREIFGTAHPDVEALALAAGIPDPAYRFGWPPMLRQSWSLIIAATMERPDLILAGSACERVATIIWGGEPWLQWREGTSELPNADDSVTGVRVSSSMQSKGLKSAQGEQRVLERDIRELVRQTGLPRRHIELALERESRWSPPQQILTRWQRDALSDAILGAFNPSELQRVLAAELSVGTWTISKHRENPDLAADVIDWAEANGRTRDLMDALARARPLRHDLQWLAVEIMGETRERGERADSVFEELTMRIRTAVIKLVSPPAGDEAEHRLASAHELADEVFAAVTEKHDIPSAARGFLFLAIGDEFRRFIAPGDSSGQDSLRTADDTVPEGLADTLTTVVYSQVSPLTAAARMQHLDDLRQADWNLADIYSLCAISGRRPEDVPELLDASLSVADVRTRLGEATAWVERK